MLSEQFRLFVLILFKRKTMFLFCFAIPVPVKIKLQLIFCLLSFGQAGEKNNEVFKNVFVVVIMRPVLSSTISQTLG